MIVKSYLLMMVAKIQHGKKIMNFAADYPQIIGIRQSRNRGHQNAVYAGLMESKDRADITISIDCDGQDDINAMDKMIAEYEKVLKLFMVLETTEKQILSLSVRLPNHFIK